MNFSNHLLSLIELELKSFDDQLDLESLVVYAVNPSSEASPVFEVVGQWPKNLNKILGPIDNDLELRAPSLNRRWYPLQDGSILIGVLRAERSSSKKMWPESLDKKLLASASVLANSLALELERKRLGKQIRQQSEQIGLLVHQLKNPLSALKTYAQLLLRKIGPDSSHRNLVEGLLVEQAQFDKYLDALDDLSKDSSPKKSFSGSHLLLPPLLPNSGSLSLKQLLEPLIERAAANAKLQGKQWYGPQEWPDWIEKSEFLAQGDIAEIVANLIENAFRYSPNDVAIGLTLNDRGLCVWDEGPSIPKKDNERIFQKGFRLKNIKNANGSGIGLSLGRQLARRMGGDLFLLDNPSAFEKNLSQSGNAFVLSIPVDTVQSKKA